MSATSLEVILTSLRLKVVSPETNMTSSVVGLTSLEMIVTSLKMCRRVWRSFDKSGEVVTILKMS